MRAEGVPTECVFGAVLDCSRSSWHATCREHRPQPARPLSAPAGAMLLKSFGPLHKQCGLSATWRPALVAYLLSASVSGGHTALRQVCRPLMQWRCVSQVLCHDGSITAAVVACDGPWAPLDVAARKGASVEAIANQGLREMREMRRDETVRL